MSDNEIVGEFLVESYENLDGNFPRASVMTSVVDLLFYDYDGADGGHLVDPFRRLSRELQLRRRCDS
jgi:hypothetical protein